MNNDECFQALMSLKGKYIKNALERLEQAGLLSPHVRKIVLDEFNDFVREVGRQLGIEIE